MIEQLLTPQLVDAIGWTLLHTLWQGALFALLLGLVLILLRAFSPQARYVVSIGFLAAFVLTVGLTFWNAYSTTGARTTSMDERLVVKRANGRMETADAPSVRIGTDQGVRGRVGPGGTLPEGAPTPVVSFLSSAGVYFDRHLPLIVTLWLMGVLVLQLRLLGQLAFVQRIKTYGTERFPSSWAERLQELEHKLDIRRPVRYLTSGRVSSPFTVGWLRPVILLPREMLSSLREHQIVTILAHELAHIKRQDFAVNVLQTFLTTFFFYHPGVWWMSARIEDEREHCCDDLAVAATGERFDYARTLVQLQEQQLAAPKLAMALGGSGFTGRISRLLTGYLNTATFGEGVITTLIFAAVLSLAIGTTGEVQASGADKMLGEASSPALAAQTQTDGEREAMERAINYAAGEAGRQVNSETFSVPATPDDPFSLLMHAIYDGDLEMVEYLLERVDDLSRTDERDFTPLMAAASENHVEITKLLIARGADVNQVHRQWTALIEAADEGSLEVAELLLDNGANMNLNPDTGRSAAVMAASEGHLDVLKLLIERGASPTAGQISPLHMAAKEGKTEIVRYLLAKGVNVDLRDADGRTALTYAASEGQTEVIKILLQAGADPELADKNGRSATLYAVEEGETESMLEVTQRMGDAAVERLVNTPEILVGPAGEGDLFTLQAMVEGLGMEIDITDGQGYTPLAMAAREGHLDVVQYLLQEGASVHGSGSTCSPLFLSVREGHPRVVETLVHAGAHLEDGCDFEWVNHDEQITFERYSGATPLMIAIEENEPGVAHLLLSLGADPNTTMTKTSYRLPGRVYDAKELEALRPEELASRYDRRYLANEWTALLQAVETGEARLVRLLLEEGAEKNHATADGLTALKLAQQLGHDDIVRLLQ